MRNNKVSVVVKSSTVDEAIGSGISQVVPSYNRSGVFLASGQEVQELRAYVTLEGALSALVP